MSKTRMGKRVASLLLSLVMMLSLLPTTVYATGGTGETSDVIVEETNTSDDNTVGGTTGNPELTGEDEGGGADVSEGETATVATIGSATYESLDAAIAAVADGETIVVNAGEYKLNGSLNYTGKAFTIAAADGAKVSFDMSAAVALHGAKITFNNVTFDYKTNGNYIGLQHADTLVYDNCTINGMVFLYAVNETFNSCTFNQESADAYNVWTYGAQNVAFNGCTFNCVGKAVLVYNEGAIAKTDLTVTDTKFVASAPVTGKAAIEIDTSLMAGGATITVDDKTTDTGFATGSNSGKTLWNDKKQTADTNKNTTVTVAGEKVFEPKATVVKPVSVNGTSYETLEDAIDAATPDANGVVTYEISGKVDVTATGWVQVAKSGLTGLTAVKFVGTTDDAKICINGGLAILADQNYDIDVSFEALALSKLNPTYGGDYGHSTNYFTTWLRNSGAAENTVTYTNCTFPNGVSNNQYGKTVFDNCKFTNGATGLYNLWNYGGSTEIKNSSFTGTRGIKAYSEGVDGGQIEVADTTFNGLGEKAAIVVSKATTVTLNKVDATECTKGLLQKDIDGGSLKTTIEANGTGISGKFDITATTTADAAKNEFNISAGTFTSEVSNDYCADGFEVKANDNGTYGVVEAATADGDGTEANPYTLEQLGTMTRQAYIEAQNRLNGTMYVTVGNYAYDTNGVLGNGVRDDTTGQIPDHSKLNAYGENGYLGEKNDGANGKSVVFVGGSITSGVTGYTSIDKIGTSLLLALPAYTNVTFKGTTFNNVMSFNYQLYTSPWSQLGELKFDGCTFNGIIVGAIAAQTLTFNGCEFKNYTNTTYANSSNPTWIRPAYGNWTQGDNEGQGSDFRSLTTINFTDNKVTSTRPVKFEYISQWDITSTVTATGNSFDISKQDGDTTIKNVGLYLGAHTDANAFNLVAENNTKSANTAALYTIPEGKTSLPLGSTVKDTKGNEVELTDALKWKAGDATADKIVLKTVEAVASVGSKQYGSLQAAIDAATAEQTVTLLTNLDLSATGLTIAANKDVTLDLNGKTLKVANTNSGNIKVVGKLTLQDSTDTAKNGTGTGKVWTETSYISGKQDKVLVAAIDGGTFIMESGLIDAASSIADNANNGQFAVSVQNENADATVIINGGCIKAGWYAIAGNGGDTTYNGNITVNGGILESTADYAIYHPHSGTTTINGGVVFGAAGGVSLNRGKLIVNNGIITSKGTGTTGDWGDGTGNQNAAAINVNAQYGLASVEIKGGKIAAEKDAILLTNGKDGTISVSGGTFSSEVKEEYCATGYIPTANADGTYGVKEGVYVAKVDNVKYETLQAAIDAAKGGSTVRLLANVTLTETAVFPAGKTVHLNLVGHNITATGTALRINGTTDIQSTGGVGTIESTGNVAVAVGDNASLTVYSGTLKGREGAVITGTSTGAKIEIRKNATLIATDNAVIAGNGSKRDGKPNTILVKGGTFVGGIVTDGYIACGIYAPWNDNVTVSGGTFNITNGAGIVARAGTVKVTDGTFNCTGTAEGYVGDSKNKVPCAALVFDKAAKYPALTESSQILVSGGSFSTDPAVNGATLADGYVATQTDGMYKVAKADPTAEINGVKYDTLQAAINAAQATKGGATITLLKNINTESYYMVNGDNPVTIDLAGYNITGSGISGLFYVTAKGDLTIKGEGTVTAVEDNGAAMAVWVRSPIAKVTLEGGTYTQQITNTADPHFDLIYVERGNVYVKGGTYKGATPDWTLNCYDEHYQSKEANIEVTGGTFVGFDPANNKAEGENTNFVPAGYVSTKGADGNFVVTEVKVAEVNGVAYATLSEAIAAAKDGDTVKLLRDINTPEISYMISKSLTIDLNGMTVTGSGYDAVFQIDNADAKVVIKNGKVVAVEQSGGAGKYTMAIWASEAGCEVTLEGLDVSQKITHTDDPQMDMIYASGGTITINSGNFVSGTPAWTLNCNDTSYKNGTAKITVTGGTFAGFDPANNKAEGEGTSFVAAGYVSRMDEDGSYTVVPANAKITVGKRLSIGNDLTITYLVNLTDCTNPWVKFQFYNDDIKGYTTVEVKNYGTATVEGPDGRPVEVFTFDFTGVNPQRMTDTLKATVYAEDASGNEVEYQVADYSVAQYCSNKLAKLDQDDSLRKLIGNLVAYGAAAQVYQNYRTDNLVSTVVSGAVSTDYTDRLSSVTQYTGKVTGAAGVTIKGKTLVLSNTFAVRVYFTVNEGVDIANVSFKVTANGKTDTVNSFEKDEKLGYYYFDYANLNATQLDSEVKFESFVNETGVGDMVTYSVNTYLAKKMPNYDKSSNAYKLMAELFNYGCACTEYASK